MKQHSDPNLYPNPITPTKSQFESNRLLKRNLAWVTVLLAYVLFTAVMTLQAYMNLWLLSLITFVVLFPLTLLCYGSGLFDLLQITPKLIIYGLMGGAFLALLSYLLFPPLADIWPGLQPALEACYRNLRAWPGHFWALPIILLLVLVEEIVWRGMLFDLLSTQWTGWRLVLLCTVLFPIPHLLTGNWVLGLAALILGGFCTLQRYRYESLTIPLITHFVWNLAVMVFFPLVSFP